MTIHHRIRSDSRFYPPSEWQKIISVDEKVANQLKNLIKEDFDRSILDDGANGIDTYA